LVTDFRTVPQLLPSQQGAYHSTDGDPLQKSTPALTTALARRLKGTDSMWYCPPVS
jgi:hypothetical protein